MPTFSVEARTFALQGQLPATAMIPHNIDVATTESPQYTLDVTSAMTGGEILGSIRQQLIVLASGGVVNSGFMGFPSVSGNIITFRINGAALTPGQKYRCIITYDIVYNTIVEATMSSEAIISVPY